MRYIDADLIRYDEDIPGVFTAPKTRINNMPTADVVDTDKVNRIYEKLADMFSTPCNFSPCDEIMLERGGCRDDCGDISEAECWKRYFEVVCDGEREES